MEITGEEDLYIAYTLNMKGGTTPLVIDQGPLVENGALVSLNNATMWMKLSNLKSEANDYNIVIGALATPASSTQSSAHQAKSYKLGNIPTKRCYRSKIQWRKILYSSSKCNTSCGTRRL